MLDVPVVLKHKLTQEQWNDILAEKIMIVDGKTFKFKLDLPGIWALWFHPWWKGPALYMGKRALYARGKLDMWNFTTTPNETPQAFQQRCLDATQDERRWAAERLIGTLLLNSNELKKMAISRQIGCLEVARKKVI